MLHAIDVRRREALVVEFTREDVARSSFLDDRALRPGMGGWRVPLGLLLDHLANVPAPAPAPGWLFHMGHVGSTAVSRALDLHAGLVGLREPLPLLALAHERQHPDFDRWLQVTRSALARRWPGVHYVVVKPTSVVTVLAPALLAGPQVRGVLLWSRLDTWLASHLREPALVASVIATARVRGVDPAMLPGTPCDALAVLWWHEQRRWQALSDATPGRLIALEFDPRAPDVARLASRAGAHLGLPLGDDFEARVAASGLGTRDAKQPGQAFDPASHVRDLERSRSLHAPAIEAAVRRIEACLEDRDDAATLHGRLRAD